MRSLAWVSRHCGAAGGSLLGREQDFGEEAWCHSYGLSGPGEFPEVSEQRFREFRARSQQKRHGVLNEWQEGFCGLGG